MADQQFSRKKINQTKNSKTKQNKKKHGKICNNIRAIYFSIPHLFFFLLTPCQHVNYSCFIFYIFNYSCFVKRIAAQSVITKQNISINRTQMANIRPTYVQNNETSYEQHFFCTPKFFFRVKSTRRRHYWCIWVSL